MFNEQALLTQLHQFGVFPEGHFCYTDGDHGRVYINKDALLPHTRATLSVCLELADRFARFNPEAVVGPVTGGAILAQNVARILSLGCHNQQDEVLALYAEKVGETFALRRGYDELVVGKRVLVVEDVLRTGGSVRKVADAVRAAGGIVVGVGALFNRGGVTAQDLGGLFRLECLFDLVLDSWPAKDCPLCKKQVPLNTAIGHGGK